MGSRHFGAGCCGSHGNSHGSNQGGRCGPAPSTVQVSTVSFHGGMAVTITSGADAIGEDTLASLNTKIGVVDRGLLTYATGTSSAVAAALSTSGSAYATSYAELGISGADYTNINTHRTEGGDGTSAISTVDLDFLALDLKWLDFATDTGNDSSSTASGQINISGNLAEFTAQLDAWADNSLVDLQVDAFSLEDQLSSSALSGLAAVDDDVTYLRYAGTSRANTITTSNADALVQAGGGDDRVTSGSGNDWIFGGDGRDQLNAGAGNDTVFGQAGNDRIQGGIGDDWLFGGKGDDTLEAGDGDDLVLGGAGRDTIDAGAGNDLIDAGLGNDTVRGGAGNDIFRLGAEHGDDNDRYWGGSGADLYFITGAFDRDVIMDFSLSAGDRLFVGAGDWESDAALRQLNGSVVTLQRASGDADDLVISFDFGDGRSQLTLDEFFSINRGYADLPRRGAFSDSAALPLLHDLFGDDLGMLTLDHQQLFQIGLTLSEMG